ncbi:sulfite exporter TauE/SafE family protein [Streptomyces sp. NPDC057638]|uniref:sulfite exporter TauE/SafE family protein n=1 Tax=Streptomyces sp. NPDC057638 TaxID=3346190 RepID=UPI00369D8AAC
MSGLILALTAGAVVGLALGALGGGGSVLAVPALIYPLGFTPAEATTASLIIVATTSASALYGHARDGHVRWRAGTLFAAAGLVPAVLTGLLAARLPADLLTAAFSVIALLAAAAMLRPSATGPENPTARTSGQDGTDGTEGPDGASGTGGGRVRAGATGAGLGAVTGLLGVGGGFLAVPALVRVVGLPMRTAVGTSLLVITLTSLVALTARTGATEGLAWAHIAPFTGAAILGAWDGRRLASKITGPSLQRLFGAILAAVALAMLLDALL